VIQHKLAVKHLSGHRANRVDRLVLPPQREIIFGRDRECHVRYNEADELVSRKHLKIVATDEQPVRYMVVDLGSRNGTFLNRQRVFGAVLLSPGARVQLGAGGPEFEFRLDPEKEAGLPAATCKQPTKSGAMFERRMALARRAVLISLPVAAGAAGYMSRARLAPLWQGWRHRQQDTHRTRFDAAAALASIASINAEWRLCQRQSGVHLAQAYIPNERLSRTERIPLVEGAPMLLPAFVLLANRQIEPLLVPAGSAPAGREIAGEWSAKGVLIPERDEVASAPPSPLPWTTPYQWAAAERAGALLIQESARVKEVVPQAAAQFPRWVPAESGWLAEQTSGDLHTNVPGRLVSGDDLRVETAATISGWGHRFEASLSDESPDVLLAAVPPGTGLAANRADQIDDGSIPLKKDQAVWVVGNRVEACEIEETSPDGRISLRTSRCGEGGVVFNQEGRVVALCKPDAHGKTGHGSAISISRALRQSSGEADGPAR
jgi:hypothetical protein